MANYSATIRTNYFSVTDKSKFREMLEACSVEDTIYIFDSEDGSGKVGFGCYGNIYGIPPEGEEDDGENDLDAFYYALQSILASGDAIIITEVGYEKLRYLVGHCTIITKKEIQFIELQEKAVKLAGKMLNNSAFSTSMDY